MASGLLNLLKKGYSTYIDSPIAVPIAVGAAGAAAMGRLGGSGWSGRNIPRDEEPHRMEVSDKSFKEVKSLLDGSELDVGKYLNSDAYKEWLSTSWKEEDNDFLRILISKTAESYKNNKPKSVSKSSWNEEYVENYRKIISLASDKEGAPKPAEIHNRLREYYYGKKDNTKDQFGHGTIQGQGPSMGNLEMQDVARY